MTSSASEKTLWVPYLHQVFASGSIREDIHQQVGSVNMLRNRIAHHEPVFDLANPSVADIHYSMMNLLKSISPEAHAFTKKHSSVAEILAQDPRR